MTGVNQLITEHLDIWTSATEKKSSAGRGNGGAVSLHGIRKLRELILELAVRGKLVSQDSTDEPAADLLVRLDQERSQNTKPKRSPRSSSIEPTQPLFDAPDGWEWSSLSTISSVIRGVTYKKTDATPSQRSGSIPLLRGNNIDRRLNYDELVYVPMDLVREEQIIQRGDIVIAMSSGSANLVGKAAQSDDDMSKTFGAFCGLVRPSSPELIEYFRFFFQTPLYRSATQAAGKGIGINNLNKGALEQLWVPLPPVAEQLRIVAKVDELMRLCDALERQAENSLKAHQSLVETCLASLTNSQTTEDLAQNWTRIEANFDTLFTTEKSMAHLKEVVLQLGVRGKLLPQNSDDEAADVLVRSIVKSGSKKRKRGRGAVGESTMISPPFQLPHNWAWHQFGDFVEFQSELVKPDGYQDDFQVAPDIIEKGTGRLTDQRTVEESGIRGPNNRFYAGQILYSKIRPSLSKAVIAPYDGLCSADMYPLKALIDPDYLLLSILSEDFLTQVRKLENRIKMPKLNVGSLSSIHIAVPPLAEQARIVEKVNSMLKICDLISSGIEKSQHYSVMIADTLTSKIH